MRLSTPIYGLKRCADHLDLSVFVRACFVHEGQIQLRSVA